MNWDAHSCYVVHELVLRDAATAQAHAEAICRAGCARVVGGPNSVLLNDGVQLQFVDRVCIDVLE